MLNEQLVTRNSHIAFRKSQFNFNKYPLATRTLHVMNPRLICVNLAESNSISNNRLNPFPLSFRQM